MNANNTLEFNIILETLAEHALSQKAREKLLSLKPFLNERECKAKMQETTEARKILEGIGTPPLASMKELDKILDLTEKGSMLAPEQLTGICGFISSCKRTKKYLNKAEAFNTGIAFYGHSLSPLDMLFGEIERCIRNEGVDDGASSVLRDIRRKIENTKSAVKIKLEDILRSKKEWFTDGYVTIRNGRFVLPVKKGYKNQLSGTVIDTSSTGSTCFIEPAAVRKLQEELSLLQIDEDNEIRKILYTLTVLVEEHINELRINKDCMETLDFIFAKAKLSIEMKAVPVSITTERKIIIKQGRHPLLKPDLCIPLDFEILGGLGDDAINGVVITGPNTGGKTVALKTIGLLSIMAQSGLHVPVSPGSVFSMHNSVFCDIGDGQSISENLSTFSSHIQNIVAILQEVSRESLVLLDELGSGTDPAEGMGLAIAILAELNQRGCLFVATTHYPEIKDFAKNTKGLMNARMEFDRENLQPLYRLQIGEAGESCALYIAKRLGFPGHMLKRAQMEAYGGRSSKLRDRPTIMFDEDNTNDEDNTKKSDNVSHNKIQKEIPKEKTPSRSESFNIGDCVRVYPQKSLGIVYRRTNEKGELGVQIKDKKQLINHKRLKLFLPASELYPEDYDFSIIFDTVAIRKARHQLAKGHDVIIEYEEHD
ncbi:endonuclease MutS2 [Desulfosporosinus meridiei]|uniref:MutS domain V n=1 Tax=Desulfosporosinus meridiei (strain ATCC BAA-275 / DSM 13257 / KCTC 12902 / NCIMB 13706 / S10) TaxID=768704 RepID=J7J295_DESMD|nr:DNA mismatch repair protein MutS [Desulfosporosinus meridiei]AFQ45101.1 MutS domain V [Desulfosporosinus meridiei DSM 13257]